jgi:hypothetical protein
MANPSSTAFATSKPTLSVHGFAWTSTELSLIVLQIPPRLTVHFQTRNSSAFRVTPVVALFIAASAASAQTTAPAAVPRALYSVGAAFDAGRDRLVVFGGYGNGGYSGDTWEWDGHAWTRASYSGPSPRNGPTLAYDSHRRRIVLFGGDTRMDGALGDTWEHDGTAWKQVATSGPVGRSTAPMVFDSRRGHMVVFGGASTGGTILGDTWEWDGTRWTQVATEGPPARTLHGMAYDSIRGRVVLFGGTGKLAPDVPSFGDTWEWDGKRWTRIDVTGPSARDHTVMAYDAKRRAVVLHGGGLDSASAETWAFDGRAWTRISTSGPPRRFATLSYDARAGKLLLYGGFDRSPSNELWSLSGSTWTRVAP